MTDMELLESAAKAAGIVIDKSRANGGPTPNSGFDVMGNAVLDWHNGTTWNPLTDDGDALRLAVSLRFLVHYNHEFERCMAEESLTEQYESDPSAATRRAIVRAAAEIGRGKQ
jgi:hypothetical protein